MRRISMDKTTLELKCMVYIHKKNFKSKSFPIFNGLPDVSVENYTFMNMQ